MYFAAGQPPPPPSTVCCPPCWAAPPNAGRGGGGVGEPLSGFWHGVGHPSGVGGGLGGWKRAAGRAGCWPWVQDKQGQLGLRGCPSPWRLGMQTGGWLQSPELAPSKRCPKPPTLPTCTLPGRPCPGHGQDASGRQAPSRRATAPKRCSRSPSFVWGSPGSHLHAPRANRSPGRLKRGQGAPVMLGQWGGISPGTRGRRGERAGGWGTGTATGLTTLLDSSPPWTLFIRALGAVWGGSRNGPGPWPPRWAVPTAGGSGCAEMSST